MVRRVELSRKSAFGVFATAAAAVALGVASPLAAQDTASESAPPAAEIQAAGNDADRSAPPVPEFNAAGERQIAFETDILSYDSDGETVTAEGNVLLQSGDRSVRAEKVTWNSRTGQILASGNVRFVDEIGNQLYTDNVELNDKFEAGAMDNLLLALRQGGRLAAESGMRQQDGSVALTRAAYSACSVVRPNGCPKEPSWKITADRVVYNPADSKVDFTGAYLELFGTRVLPLPGLAIRTDGGATSGVLIPDLRISKSNGVEVSGSYYLRFADNKDLELTAHVYTEAPPMLSGQYRHLHEKGAYQITGYLTHSRRISDFDTNNPVGEADFRGYVFANGKFQFTPEWSLTGSIRRASDRTFLRRYDISRDDRLRSMLNLERIDSNSYFSLAGWATQTLRLN